MAHLINVTITSDRLVWVFVRREIGRNVLHNCHYNQLSKAEGRIGCVTGGRMQE